MNNACGRHRIIRSARDVSAPAAVRERARRGDLEHLFETRAAAPRRARTRSSARAWPPRSPSSAPSRRTDCRTARGRPPARCARQRGPRPCGFPRTTHPPAPSRSDHVTLDAVQIVEPIRQLELERAPVADVHQAVDARQRLALPHAAEQRLRRGPALRRVEAGAPVHPAHGGALLRRAHADGGLRGRQRRIHARVVGGNRQPLECQHAEAGRLAAGRRRRRGARRRLYSCTSSADAFGTRLCAGPPRRQHIHVHRRQHRRVTAARDCTLVHALA